MLVLLLVLLLALILAGAGFALHLLWWLAIIVLAVWLLGFLVRSARSTGGRSLWYRWLRVPVRPPLDGCLLAGAVRARWPAGIPT